MGKRQRTVRSKPGDYLPYGKPAAVKIVHVEAEQVADGRVIEARYVEHFDGLRVEDRPPRAAPDRGDLHPDTCKGRLGVAIVWWRDDRWWCHGCYVMRYAEQPPAEFKVKRPPSAGPSKVGRKAASPIDQMFKGFKL